MKEEKKEPIKLLESRLLSIGHELLKSNIDAKENLLEKVRKIIERTLISCAMQMTNSNISKASRLLGINRNTLRRKLEELDLKLNK